MKYKTPWSYIGEEEPVLSPSIWMPPDNLLCPDFKASPEIALLYQDKLKNTDWYWRLQVHTQDFIKENCSSCPYSPTTGKNEIHCTYTIPVEDQFGWCYPMNVIADGHSCSFRHSQYMKRVALAIEKAPQSEWPSIQERLQQEYLERI